MKIAKTAGILLAQMLMAELSSWRFTEFTSQVLGRNDMAFIVVWCRFGRNFRRIVPHDMARLMACGGRSFAPDPRIFKAWTDAPNDGF